MIEKRKFGDLAHVDHDWLQARHHFSFGKYWDPARMGFGPIRVWNDDEIKPKTGFPIATIWETKAAPRRAMFK